MKIAFVIEYFPPFAAGGSEWSTFYLAQDLAKIGHQVIVITPNYNAKVQQKESKVKIIRFPFYLKIKKPAILPGNFMLTNPIWLIWTAINIFLTIQKEKPDIIHIHGKYSIPPTVLANVFLKKPVTATIRDYMIICNYGICLTENEIACNLKDYFLKDFPKYIQIYVQNKNISSLVLNITYAIWGRLAKNYLKFFTNKVDFLICLSDKQRFILKRNGVRSKLDVIQTNYKFKKIISKKNIRKNVLFVGRLTNGKGIKLFLESIPKIKNKIQDVSFTIIGTGPLKSLVKKFTKSHRSVKYLNYMDHKKLQHFFQNSSISAVPSIWPDPLPRVAMESIANGTPVVATNAGGLPEIIKKNYYGYIANKDPDDLAKKILLALNNEQKLRENIYKDFEKLSEKYGPKLAIRHLEIYKRLIKRKKLRN